jgi:hypothetical protein
MIKALIILAKYEKRLSNYSNDAELPVGPSTESIVNH